jgi:hypothetical protein
MPKFQAVQRAHEILIDSNNRAVYDSKRQKLGQIRQSQAEGTVKRTPTPRTMTTSTFPSSPIRRTTMGNRLNPSSFSKVSRLQEIARTIRGLRQDQTILDRSQFYETVLALLAEIVLEIAKLWPEAESTSQDSTFDATSTSIRVRDLHLQLKIWHGDLIDPKTSFGSWQNDVDFRQSALCQAVE